MTMTKQAPGTHVVDAGDLPAVRRAMSTIVGINITPFDADGHVNKAALVDNLNFLAEAGVEVITPCGNTGEYFSLSEAECRDVTSLACETLAGRANVLVGVGRDLNTAIDQAKHAQQCGAQAVMVHHPPHPFVSRQGYVRYIAKIAETVDIGVVPYFKAPAVPDVALLEVTRIENVVAVKYAVNDLQRFAAAANDDTAGEVAWLCGTAESWAPFFFAAGATGFTSGLVNVAPRLSQEMLRALRAGDQSGAMRVWQAVKVFEDLRARNASEFNVSVVKEAMHQAGLGTRDVRLPITELNEADRAAVAAALRQWKLA